jgi:hypothetical protein
MSGAVHVWQRCHGCGAAPIIGSRYDCQTCPAGPDNHLCAICFTRFEAGDLRHPAPGTHAQGLSLTTAHVFAAGLGARPAQLAPWGSVPAISAPAPEVPDRFVLRPEFRTSTASYWGSFAFAIEALSGAGVLVVTALHVLDELIRAEGVDCSPANQRYTGEELPHAVVRVALYDPCAPNWMLAEIGNASRMLQLPAARVGEQEPYCQRDIAAFVPDERLPLRAGLLAARPPQIGEPVWLAAPTGHPDASRTRAAVVVEISEAALIFRFIGGTVSPRYTSGAPVLNARSEVVGINIGAGRVGTDRYGHAHHVGNMRRHLEANIDENGRFV